MRSEECVAARARGRGYASEKACFGATRFQSGTDPVGAKRSSMVVCTQITLGLLTSLNGLTLK